MKYPGLNVFVAWFLISETLIRGWIAWVGRTLLELFGVHTEMEGIPGQVVGAVLLLAGLMAAWRILGSLPPGPGNPEGNGYTLGHRLLLAANIGAGLLFLFPFTFQLLPNPAVVMVVSKILVAMGYLAIGMASIGLALIYQSTQPSIPAER